MKHFTLLLIASLLTTTLTAQMMTEDLYSSPVTTKKWKIKTIGFTSGTDYDMLKELDGDLLLNSTTDPVKMDLSDMPLGEERLYEMICENPRFSLQLSLEPHYNSRHELRFETNIVWDRIDQVEYRDLMVDEDGNEFEESLLIKALSKEISVGAAYLWNTKRFGPLVLYGGAGTQMGITYDGEVSIDHRSREMPENIGDNIPDSPFYSNAYEHYDQKAGFAQRIYFQFGMNFIIKNRVELGLDAKSGFGFRTISGSASPTESHGVGISFRYRFD